MRIGHGCIFRTSGTCTPDELRDCVWMESHARSHSAHSYYRTRAFGLSVV